MKQKAMSLYDYNDYREFLKDFLRDKTKNQRGSIGKLATSLNVNSAMVSQIIHEKSHLSPEQALRLTKHYGFSNLETEYFMALVSMNRAGDKETKKYYQEKVLSLAKLGETLKEQLNYQNSRKPFDEGVYYSQWYYSAAWLLTAITPQTKQSLCGLLNISAEALEPALLFLTEAGLIKHELGKYIYSGSHVHVGKDSKHLRQHHINWRLKAVQALQSDDINQNFHFTGAIVLSKEDVIKISSKILDFLKEFREITGPSANEELLCLNLDWFKVTKHD